MLKKISPTQNFLVLGIFDYPTLVNLLAAFV